MDKQTLDLEIKEKESQVIKLKIRRQKNINLTPLKRISRSVLSGGFVLCSNK
jgi:hypothetical protein